MKIEEVNQMATVLNNLHESLFQSYHLVNLVMEMVNRGDSKETINDVVSFIRGCRGYANK
jgi:hypothetical protein